MTDQYGAGTCNNIPKFVVMLNSGGVKNEIQFFNAHDRHVWSHNGNTKILFVLHAIYKG